MSKCPKCGIEVESGMKFCWECGSPILQTKKCPKCGLEFPLTTKFCGECGYNFNAASSSGGSVIGDKNVVAGDVHIDQSSTINNNTVNNVTNTTIINQDETKKVVQCAVCGHQHSVTNSAICQMCHQHACDDHYDSNWQMCVNCARAAKENAEGAFFDAFENGNPDFDQYMVFRKQGHISDDRLLELLTEKEHKRESVGFAIRELLKHSNRASDSCLLARLYETGAVGYVSEKRAVVYYRKAAKRGDRFATDRLAALNAPIEGTDTRFEIRYGSKGVSFGRDVFETAVDLFGLTPEEKAKYSDPANCREHVSSYVVDGNTLTITPEGDNSSRRTAYEVRLLGKQGVSNNVKLINVVRDATGLGIEDAKRLVNAAPTRVAVFAARDKADAVCQELASLGATAEVRETDDLSAIKKDEKVIQLDHYRDKTGIRYVVIEGEGPFKNVISNKVPDRTCLYSARDMVGEMVFSVIGSEEFDEELLDVYWSYYYGEGGVEYTFLDHLEYAGEVLQPLQEDELADMGESTHTCYEGQDAGFEAFDLNAPSRHFRKVRFELKADWVHVGCDKIEEWDRIAKIRRRELSNFGDDCSREYLALIGARLRVVDVETSSQVGDFVLDPKVPSGIRYGQRENYFEDWLVNFDGDGSESKYLLACKRYVSHGLCSEQVLTIEGDFDPAKLEVRWQPLCPFGGAEDPGEYLLDNSDLRYDGKLVVDTHKTVNTPSAMYGSDNVYIPLKDRGEVVPVEQWKSWLLTKNRREEVDLWGDWVNA